MTAALQAIEMVVSRGFGQLAVVNEAVMHQMNASESKAMHRKGLNWARLLCRRHQTILSLVNGIQSYRLSSRKPTGCVTSPYRCFTF